MKDVLPHLLEETYMCFCIAVPWHINLSLAIMLPYPLVCVDYIFTSFCWRRDGWRAITLGLQWRLKWLWRLCCWHSCSVASRSILMTVCILAEDFNWYRTLLWRQLCTRTCSLCKISDIDSCSRTFLSYNMHCIHKHMGRKGIITSLQ
jgi:hypothetical protein